MSLIDFLKASFSPAPLSYLIEFLSCHCIILLCYFLYWFQLLVSNALDCHLIHTGQDALRPSLISVWLYIILLILTKLFELIASFDPRLHSSSLPRFSFWDQLFYQSWFFHVKLKALLILFYPHSCQTILLRYFRILF